MGGGEGGGGPQCRPSPGNGPCCYFPNFPVQCPLSIVRDGNVAGGYLLNYVPVNF